MSKSRTRFGWKHPEHRFDIRTEVSKFFEQIGLNPEKDLRFSVLYHYTSTSVALKILDSQRFWATAHDCTNDKGELVSANTIVFEVAQLCRRNAKGLAAWVLDGFLREYDREAIARIRTAYLCCFSTVRDDESQWRRYGDNGKGVCLGFRIVNEPGPESPQTFSRMFEVVYSEDSLRKWFSETLEGTCVALAKYPITAQTIRFALATIRGFAAFAAITTKTPDWSSEHEVRHVTLDRFESGVTPSVRISADCKEIRYLPVTLRADRKLMALDEIIIGARQDFEIVRKQFETLLASKGYVKGTIEYPRFNVSAVCQTEQAPATSEKPVVNNPPAAEKQANEQPKWWPPPPPWDIYWPTWVLVVITGLAVRAAIKTLGSINAQVQEMRKTGEQTDKLIAENIAQSKSMQQSVAEAARLASAMEVVAKEIAVSSKAAMASVTSINQQMRAYLCVVIGSAVYQDRAKNLKFQAIPSIVNAGLTPAHKVSFSASAAILPIPLPADFTFPLPASTSGTSVIGPRQNITVSPIVEDFCEDLEIEGIKHAAQGKALYAWGIFNYEDIFRNPQYTKFCQIYTWFQDGKTVWGYYADRHNDAS